MIKQVKKKRKYYNSFFKKKKLITEQYNVIMIQDKESGPVITDTEIKIPNVNYIGNFSGTESIFHKGRNPNKKSMKYYHKFLITNEDYHKQVQQQQQKQKQQQKLKRPLEQSDKQQKEERERAAKRAKEKKKDIIIIDPTSSEEKEEKEEVQVITLIDNNFSKFIISNENNYLISVDNDNNQPVQEIPKFLGDGILVKMNRIFAKSFIKFDEEENSIEIEKLNRLFKFTNNSIKGFYDTENSIKLKTFQRYIKRNVQDSINKLLVYYNIKREEKPLFELILKNNLTLGYDYGLFNWNYLINLICFIIERNESIKEKGKGKTNKYEKDLQRIFNHTLFLYRLSAIKNSAKFTKMMKRKLVINFENYYSEKFGNNLGDLVVSWNDLPNLFRMRYNNNLGKEIYVGSKDIIKTSLFSVLKIFDIYKYPITDKLFEIIKKTYKTGLKTTELIEEFSINSLFKKIKLSKFAVTRKGFPNLIKQEEQTSQHIIGNLDIDKMKKQITENEDEIKNRTTIIDEMKKNPLQTDELKQEIIKNEEEITKILTKNEEIKEQIIKSDDMKLQLLKIEDEMKKQITINGEINKFVGSIWGYKKDEKINIYDYLIDKFDDTKTIIEKLSALKYQNILDEAQKYIVLRFIFENQEKEKPEEKKTIYANLYYFFHKRDKLNIRNTYTITFESFDGDILEVDIQKINNTIREQKYEGDDVKFLKSIKERYNIKNYKSTGFRIANNKKNGELFYDNSTNSLNKVYVKIKDNKFEEFYIKMKEMAITDLESLFQLNKIYFMPAPTVELYKNNLIIRTLFDYLTTLLSFNMDDVPLWIRTESELLEDEPITSNIIKYNTEILYEIFGNKMFNSLKIMINIINHPLDSDRFNNMFLLSSKLKYYSPDNSKKLNSLFDKINYFINIIGFQEFIGKFSTTIIEKLPYFDDVAYPELIDSVLIFIESILSINYDQISNQFIEYNLNNEELKIVKKYGEIQNVFLNKLYVKQEHLYYKIITEILLNDKKNEKYYSKIGNFNSKILIIKNRKDSKLLKDLK